MESNTPEVKKKKAPFGGIIFILMIVFALMAYPLVKEIVLDVYGVEMTGTVIEVIKRGQNLAPVVEFTTRSGERIEFRGASTNFLSYIKGEEVQLRYLEAYPRMASLNDMRYIMYAISCCSEGFILPTLAVLFLVWLAELRGKPFVLDLRRFRK